MRGWVLLGLLLGCRTMGEAVPESSEHSALPAAMQRAGGPCLDGGWGWIDAPHAAVHVDPLAAHGGSGSRDHSFASLDATRAEIDPDRGGEVALWPGSFTEVAPRWVGSGRLGLRACDEGVLVRGVSSEAALQPVRIEPVGGAVVAVADGSPSVLDVELREATGVGWVAESADVVASEIWIDDTQTGLGGLGRAEAWA